VAPNKWKELLSVIEDARRSSDTESNPRPYVIEGNASSSRPGRASKDKALGGWRRSERVRIAIPRRLRPYLIPVCLHSLGGLQAGA